MNPLANSSVINYKNIYDGVNYFTPFDWWGRHFSPAELLQAHIEALSWLSTNGLRFNTLKSKLIKWPKECIHWFDMTAEEILETWIINGDACIQYLNWSQEDVDFYQRGYFHESTLKEDGSYRALKNIVDWMSKEVDKIFTKMELKEIQRKRGIYIKYYQKWVLFWQFIRNTKQKIISIF